MNLNPFHLAVPVRDLEEARSFYGQLLGCEEGRSSDSWIDFNFFGHQFVVHLNRTLGKDGSNASIHNPVDGHGVPVPHFGIVLTMKDWEKLAESMRGKVEFVIEPYIRFKGQVGEQATMFFYDPSGNALEFKAFKDINQLFAK
ncbi:MAG: VOC family protein [Saprospiraceae bacterium]|nr:VOC family protein [Saprospiraceae bacterium]MCB9322449.1 VOC family protein [Lewinellaceae bacterium]